MAHFTRIRAPGFWTYKTSILHTEMETIDANLAKAINGDGGGVYAPTSTIEIGGLGIKITGLAEFTSGIEVTNLALFHSDAKVEGVLSVAGDPIVGYKLTVVGAARITTNLSVTADASIGGNLSVTGTAAIGGVAAFGANVTFAAQVGIGGTVGVGYALKVTGNEKITGNLSVDGFCSFTDGVTCNDTLTVVGDTTLSAGLGVGGNAVLGGTLAVAGATTLAGTTTANLHATGDTTVDGVFKGKGRHQRRVFTMTDTNPTVDVGSYDMVFCPTATLSAIRTLTLANTNAVEGDVFHVVTEDTGYEMNVNTAVGPTSLKAGAHASVGWFAEFTFINSNWRLSKYGDMY